METSKMRPIMLGIIGVGLLCAAFLPAMKINFISFLGAIPMEFSLREATNALSNGGKGWTVLIAIAGVIIVIRTALIYDDSDKERSRWWITGGTALTLLFPFNLLRAVDSLMAEANREAEGVAIVDTSLASGTIIASIAFIVVTALAWYASTQTTDIPTYVSPFDSSQSVSRPGWMTEQEHR